MQTDDPPFLAAGTEVSAKFKGAYCEATVKSVAKSVKLRISFKEVRYGSMWVALDRVTDGPIELNGVVTVKVTGGDQSKTVGTIVAAKDSSVYVVVFNDGDERTLRRTHLCVKGAKHYGDESLDTMPLINPEQFYSPHQPAKVPADDGSPTESTSKKASSKTPSTKTPKARGRPPSAKRLKNASATPAKCDRPTTSTSTAATDAAAADSDDVDASERDAFVARWYKFMEDRGDPANRAPTLGSGRQTTELDLYALYRAVRACGGFNRVNKDGNWARVMTKMRLTGAPDVTPLMVKNAYKRYMVNFDVFVRQFGWSMSGGERRIPVDDNDGDGKQRHTSGKVKDKRQPSPAKQQQKKADAPADELITAVRERKRSLSMTPSSAESNGEKGSAGTLGKDGCVAKSTQPMVGTTRVERAQMPGVASPAVTVYVGQRIDALCNDRWYDARILLIDAADGGPVVVAKKANALGNQLPTVARVHVHYHGWKARFDEWRTPEQIRVASGRVDSGDNNVPLVVTEPNAVQGETATQRMPPVQRDVQKIRAKEEDDAVHTDSTETGSLLTRSRRGEQRGREVVPPVQAQRKRQISVSNESETLKRSRRSVKESTSAAAASKRNASVKNDVQPAQMTIGNGESGDEDERAAGEEDVKNSSDEDEEDTSDLDDVKIEARVTRSRAAADPIVRKWSRSNILLLEESEEAITTVSRTTTDVSQVVHIPMCEIAEQPPIDTDVSTTVTQSAKICVLQMESKIKSESPSALKMSTEAIASPMLSDADAKQGECVQRVKKHSSEVDEAEVARAPANKSNVKPSSANRSRRNNRHASSKTAAGAHAGAAGSSTPSRPKHESDGNDSDHTPTSTAVHHSPAKMDGLIALKHRVLAKLTLENHDFNADCERIVKLDANLTDEECIELLKKRMSKVRRMYGKQRSKLQKIEKKIKAMSSATVNHGARHESSSSSAIMTTTESSK